MRVLLLPGKRETAENETECKRAEVRTVLVQKYIAVPESSCLEKDLSTFKHSRLQIQMGCSADFPRSSSSNSRLAGHLLAENGDIQGYQARARCQRRRWRSVWS